MNKLYELSEFQKSLLLKGHPLILEKEKTKQKYYAILHFFALKVSADKSTAYRLTQYRETFGILKVQWNPDDSKVYWFLHFERKRLYLLILDLFLILPERSTFFRAICEIKSYFKTLSAKDSIDDFISEFCKGCSDFKYRNYCQPMLKQVYENCTLTNLNSYRMLITANMSAGKSTLINALIVKKIVRTASEACTGNICYIYNKPFEDEHIHMLCHHDLNLNADEAVLNTFDWNQEIYFASYFRNSFSQMHNLCIIDTPGVDFSLNKTHGEITRAAIQSQQYDKLVYVLSASSLGTDAELQYLSWIAGNVPAEKTVFVVNKLDKFKASEDNIETSLENVRQDLLKLGYTNPVICPVSAYCALLVKMNQYGDILSEDEQDEYELYQKKFKKESYDLSKFYPDVNTENIKNSLLFRCGFYGLENTLFERV